MVKQKKKGFSRKRVYDLEFRDGDPITDGLEVKATAPTVAESYELGVRKEDETQAAYLRRQMTELVGHVVEWNLLDDDDEPLPTTLEALESVDIYVVRRITDAWFDIGKVMDEASPLDSRSGRVSPGGSTTVPDPRIEASIRAQALP
jgi:hypothetical protein